MDNQDSNITTIDSNKPINVVVNRPPVNQANTIDLLAICSNIWAKRRIYIWLIAVCALLATSLAFTKILLSRQKAPAQAVLYFEYSGASLGRNSYVDPRGSSLSFDTIGSAYIVEKALNNLSVYDRKGLTVASVISNLKYQPVETESYKKQKELYSAIVAKDPTKADTYDEMVQESYTNRLVITLNNGFGQDAIMISDGSLKNLLNSIVYEFNQYFFETYQDFTYPSSVFASIDVNKYEYVDFVEEINKAINSFDSYLSSTGSYYDYTSDKTGISFSNIKATLDLMRNNELSTLNAYIIKTGIAKDSDNLISKYEYSLRSLNQSLTEIEANIEVNADAITNYRFESSSYVNPDGSVTDLGTSITDNYNNLILQQSGLQSQKAEVLSQIKNLQDRIDVVKKNKSSDEGQAVYAEIKAVYDKFLELYDLAYAQADEIANKVNRKEQKLSSVDAQVKSESVLNSANIKTLLTFFLVGIVIACMIWALDGTIVELKKGNKNAEVVK